MPLSLAECACVALPSRPQPPLGAPSSRQRLVIAPVSAQHHLAVVTQGTGTERLLGVCVTGPIFDSGGPTLVAPSSTSPAFQMVAAY